MLGDVNKLFVFDGIKSRLPLKNLFCFNYAWDPITLSTVAKRVVIAEISFLLSISTDQLYSYRLMIFIQSLFFTIFSTNLNGNST